MIPRKSLLEFLNKFIPLTQDEFNEFIAPFVIKRNFGKKAIVTRAGEIENYINFIEIGLVRKYYKKEKEEINTQISNEGHIIHAQESFHGRIPSEYFVETIEPTEFSSITFEGLEKMYSSSEKMQRLGRLVVTATMVLKDKRQSQMVKLTPRERFIRFVTKHPELMQRVPQNPPWWCLKHWNRQYSFHSLTIRWKRHLINFPREKEWVA